MNVLWHKVWFDLWHHKTRTLLVILSIATGVFAVGAIFGMVDQLQGGMDEAHRAVAPSHVNIILRSPVDQETATGLLDIPGVVQVDPANLLSVRYKSNADADWQLGSLVMRPDYEAQIYDQVVLKEGAWPAGEEIGIERLSAQFFAIGVGEEVIFEIDGEERRFNVGGTIRHPFVEPPPFGGQAHFFADAEGLSQFGVPAGYYGQLLVRVEPYTRDQAEAVAGEIRARLADEGAGVAVTIYQDPERHWGRMFVDGVMLVLRIMALTALFLSVVLVANTLTAVIAQQADQIGVIKAVGGTSRVVARTYLAGVLVYGLLALLVALPLGALTSYASSRWFLNLFNIDYEVFRLAPQAIIWQVLAALLVPLVAGLWPVLRGARLTVREAIASYGLGGDFGRSRLDKFIDRLGARLLPTLYAAALGNLFRRKGRLILTQLVLICAGVMFLVVMSLISSTNLTLDNEMARRGYDVRIGFQTQQDALEVEQMAREVAGVEVAELWFARNAALLREGERLRDSAGLGAQLNGVPADSQMQLPLITAGRWLQPDDGQVVVISQSSALENGIAVGDRLRLDLGSQGESEWEVIGTYKVVYDGGFVTEAVYAPAAAVSSVTGEAGRGSLLYVATADPAPNATSRVSDDLQELFEAGGMDVDLYTSAVKAQERVELDNQFYSVVSMFLGLAMLMATVGGMGLMGALGISVVERTREIGVLRAVGASSGAIRGLFIMEGALQGILSWVLAVPAAFLLGQPLARALGQAMLEIDLDYAFHYPAVAMWLATIVVIAVLAAVLPARTATRISVRESLAYA